MSDKYLKGRLTIVNPDEIAKQLASTDTNYRGAAALKAGRLAVRQQNDLLRKKSNFAMETTLTGKRELKLMEAAKSQGYKVNLIFIGVDAANVSQSRVRARVLKGGHYVPQDDVARRYPRSMANLDKALRLSDRAFVLDNSYARRRLLLALEKGNVKFKSRNIPKWAVKATASVDAIEDQNAAARNTVDRTRSQHRVTEIQETRDETTKPGPYKDKAHDFKQLPRKDLLKKYPNDQAIQDVVDVSSIAAKFAQTQISSEVDRIRFLDKVRGRIAGNIEHGRPNQAPRVLEEKTQGKNELER